MCKIINFQKLLWCYKCRVYTIKSLGVASVWYFKNICMHWRKSGGGGRDGGIHSPTVFQMSIRSKKYQILKIILPHWKSATIQTPYPKLMILVSFCWKMNVLPNEIQNNSVSSTMFMKLTIKVVAFFLGHPVYMSLHTCIVLIQNVKTLSLSRPTHFTHKIKMEKMEVL